jgi:twitching motility protein PilT
MTHYKKIMADNLNQLLDAMIENGASDLHLHVGRSPSLRVSGSVISVEGPVLTSEDTKKIADSIVPSVHLEKLKQDGGCDFGMSFRNQNRLRVNVHRAKGEIGIVLRLIPANIFTLEDLRLPPIS